ncbi:hypothetical protein C2G38_1513781 [Gigaspora rosea]|uniref:Uncharacterized protein n=1 Tax=Gigaspora rosea TaxID=44941 RepID=A0A397W0T0_9GLOM|nr:hypothetical protein C2G38_1513781 [Gigaspora rosea]
MSKDLINIYKAGRIFIMEHITTSKSKRRRNALYFRVGLFTRNKEANLKELIKYYYTLAISIYTPNTVL